MAKSRVRAAFLFSRARSDNRRPQAVDNYRQKRRQNLAWNQAPVVGPVHPQRETRPVRCWSSCPPDPSSREAWGSRHEPVPRTPWVTDHAGGGRTPHVPPPCPGSALLAAGHPCARTSSRPRAHHVSLSGRAPGIGPDPSHPCARPVTVRESQVNGHPPARVAGPLAQRHTRKLVDR